MSWQASKQDMAFEKEQEGKIMTELQVTINNLKEIIIAADLFLQKLEKAKKDLEKPPAHKWEHGDVFQYNSESVMIYLHLNPRSPGSEPQVFRISNDMATTAPSDVYLANAKFLFNIKGKL